MSAFYCMLNTHYRIVSYCEYQWVICEGVCVCVDMSNHSCIAQWGDTNSEIFTVSFSADETSCYSINSEGKVGVGVGCSLAQYTLAT